MKLTVWTYEGPTHVGAMRVVTGMKDLHFVLHAPQGDTYADLLFTMIERRNHRPPVTFTTFQARDLGSDTSELFKVTAREAYQRFLPKVILVGSSCTAELIQDDPGGLAQTLGLPVPVLKLDLQSYSKKENWGAAETFYQIVSQLADQSLRPPTRAGRRPCCNLLGPTALGFRHRDDVREVTRLLDVMGIDVMMCAPMGASAEQIARIGTADFNIVMYPEIAETAARWLERKFHQPCVHTVPIGYGATREFIEEVATIAGVDAAPALAASQSRLPWYSRSVDSTYLTGKRVFIFGDATHAIAAARVASEEIGFQVVGVGSYSREFSRQVRAAAERLGLEAIISDDYLEIEAKIIELQPELVLGTQMERHIAKRLGIASAVISAPVHVQDFPSRYSPQMGFEGTNVIFDSWVHPLVMGLEDHLLHMFREDFEFNDEAGASHLGGHGTATSRQPPTILSSPTPGQLSWANDAEEELKKIPFFVRGKARRNTEKYAEQRGVSVIDLATLYDAKSYYAR